MTKKTRPEADCPCGSGLSYSQCCQPLHQGDTVAATAERLMRSRYSAYALGLEDYLLESWHPDTRPGQLDLAADQAVKWVGLEIVDCQAGAVGDESGVVEFIARFKLNGKAERLHERSRFRQQQGRWYYLDGELGA